MAIFGLYKRGKYWWVDFRRGGVRVHKSTGCAEKTDAEKTAKRWYDENSMRLAGLDVPQEVPTLLGALKQWLKTNRGVLSDRHLVTTECKLRLHMQPCMDLRLDQITTGHVETARAVYLAGEGRRSPGGANSLVKALNTIYGWAIRRGLVARKPYSVPRVKEQKTPRRVVPLEMYPAFLAALDAPYRGNPKHRQKKPRQKNPHVRVAIRLMLALGLREREAMAARWEWFDWAARTYYAGKTKNGKVRLIPVPRWLVGFLEPMRQPSGLLCPQEDGSPHTAQFTEKVLAAIGETLGLPGLTPHRLRATFATNMARAGTPLPDIQVWLGHGDITTTMIYVENVGASGLAAQDRLEELAGLGPHSPQPDPQS